MIEKCFFCDKMIVPLRFITMTEVEEFFKDNHMSFTLNHERSIKKIGNKIICLSCEEDLRSIIPCNKKQKNNDERFGEDDDD